MLSMLTWSSSFTKTKFCAKKSNKRWYFSTKTSRLAWKHQKAYCKLTICWTRVVLGTRACLAPNVHFLLDENESKLSFQREYCPAPREFVWQAACAAGGILRASVFVLTVKKRGEEIDEESCSRVKFPRDYGMKFSRCRLGFLCLGDCLKLSGVIYGIFGSISAHFCPRVLQLIATFAPDFNQSTPRHASFPWESALNCTGIQGEAVIIIRAI